MDLVILGIGRLRSSFREACDDYLRRLSRYTKVSEIEVREASRAPTLAREGSAWTSEELARRMEGWRVAARPLAFVLGGSHGLASGLLDSAAARWSLGPLTLPHELARVVVAEQLYRAFTIIRGEPYHKGRP